MQEVFEQASRWVGWSGRDTCESLGWRYCRFCARLHADNCPDNPGLAHHASLWFFSFRRGPSLYRDAYAGRSITSGAIWWVKSWTLFLGLISHLLEALYGISGGFTLTDQFALAGTGLVNLTNNVAWAYLFLIVLTPLISYTLFFGRLGNLAALRFRFVGLSTLVRAGTQVLR